MKAGHHVEAERYFNQLVKDPTMDAAHRTDGQKGLDEARAKLGRIEFSVTPGTDVILDNERIGTTPLESVYVEPGAHTLKYRSESGGAETQMMSVLAGETKAARFGASSVTPRETPTSTPRETPPVPTSTGTSTSNPPPDESSTSSSNPPRPPDSDKTTGGSSIFAPPKNLTPVWLMGGVTVAGFVTAIVMGVFKNSAQNNVNNVAAQIRAQPGANSSTCVNPTTFFAGACSALTNDINQVNQDATAGNVAVAIGIAGAVGTAIYWLASEKNDSVSPATAAQSAPKVTFTPTLGMRSGGLSVGGSF